MLLPDKDIVAISTIYRKINIWKNEKAAPYGLSAAQVPIVILVCKNDGMSQNDVVEQMALEKSVVAKSIGKLITSGYLTRQKNPEDKRAYDLFPTPKAMEIYPALVQQGQQCMNLLTTGLSVAQKEQLSKLLDKLLENSFTQFK